MPDTGNYPPQEASHDAIFGAIQELTQSVGKEFSAVKQAQSASNVEFGIMNERLLNHLKTHPQQPCATVKDVKTELKEHEGKHWAVTLAVIGATAAAIAAVIVALLKG